MEYMCVWLLRFYIQRMMGKEGDNQVCMKFLVMVIWCVAPYHMSLSLVLDVHMHDYQGRQRICIHAWRQPPIVFKGFVRS
jgi:hypothetical protein